MNWVMLFQDHLHLFIPGREIECAMGERYLFRVDESHTLAEDLLEPHWHFPCIVERHLEFRVTGKNFISPVSRQRHLNFFDGNLTNQGCGYNRIVTERLVV